MSPPAPHPVHFSRDAHSGGPGGRRRCRAKTEETVGPARDHSLDVALRDVRASGTSSLATLMLDLASLPRGVRDRLAMLDLAANLVLCAATFSPWERMVTLELECKACGERSSVTGDPFGARWIPRVSHDCPLRLRAA
jgi:hypothetical protein